MYLCIYVCEMYVCMYGKKHGGSCTCTFFFFLLRSVFLFGGMRDGGFDGEGGREVGTLKSRGIHTYMAKIVCSVVSVRGWIRVGKIGMT